MDASEAHSVELAVQVNISSTEAITNDDYAVRSDQVALVRGEPVVTALQKVDALVLNKTASASGVFPGDLLTYTLSVTDAHALIPGTNVVLTDMLPAGTTFVSATGFYSFDGSAVRWAFPVLNAGETLTVDLVVKVDLFNSAFITNTDYSVYSDQMVLVHGIPVNTLLGKVFFLPITIKTP